MRILDHESDVICRIFKAHLAGRTAREIANGLNEDGVIAPRGGSWDASTINGNKAHSHGRRGRTPKRPFSGLLRCGKCGGGMSIHDRSGSAIRIRCSTARESGSCDNDKRYRLDKIEHAVLAKLKAELADPIYVKE
ncbi:recombinase zinc beta ribbon domain-containing protein [Roseinatronobacter sp. NSM]|uniref:recombinase zinc beta ribbon domain-containing protein n=1 Tax=Roseinatronobacter sp. NSM TaxID=3457785 RepID=UPI0040361A0C